MMLPSGEPWATEGPRERALENGFETLGDAELIAVLLGTGARDRPVLSVATELLDQTGGIVGLMHLGAHALAEQHGIGLVKAARISAGIELGRRALSRASTSARPILSSSEGVSRWARGRLAELDHEQIWVLALDGRNALRSARRIAQGGLHGCSLDVRDVLRTVVREAASAFVLVHNHPSGDPNPSREDIELTTLLARAAAIIGTPLLDHVVIAGEGHASLFDLGLIETRSQRAPPK
jgi:DNA repair protein RadC